jgi:hypothetical protein
MPSPYRCSRYLIPAAKVSGESSVSICHFYNAVAFFSLHLDTAFQISNKCRPFVAATRAMVRIVYCQFFLVTSSFSRRDSCAGICKQLVEFNSVDRTAPRIASHRAFWFALSSDFLNNMPLQRLHAPGMHRIRPVLPLHESILKYVKFSLYFSH